MSVFAVSIIILPIVMAYAPLSNLYEHRKPLTLVDSSHKTALDRIVELEKENKYLKGQNKDKDKQIKDLQEEKRKPVDCSTLQDDLMVERAKNKNLTMENIKISANNNLLTNQREEQFAEILNLTRENVRIANAKAILSKKLEILMLRCQIEDLENTYGEKSPVPEGEEKALRKHEVIWRHILKKKAGHNAIKTIIAKLKTIHLSHEDFAASMDDIYAELCLRVQMMLKDPFMVPPLPKRFLPAVGVIAYVYEFKPVVIL